MTFSVVSESEREPKFYGRRKGHPLRARAERLVAELLPRVAVPDPAPGGLDIATLFSPDCPDLWMEIGFGKGEHLAAQAAAHPEVGFIGCEPFINGVAGALAEIEDRGLGNVRLFADDVRYLLPALPDVSIGRLFLLFPDPWPKTRHHKRRFINLENLDALARILKDGAQFRFATDHMGYCRWALARLMAHPAFEWLAEGPDDWRARPADAAPTRYEQKARREGKACVYLTFRRRPR